LIAVFTSSQQYETAAVVFALRIVVTPLARQLEAFGDPRRIVDERPGKVVVECRRCRTSLG
jgi:hypothetical protein